MLTNLHDLILRYSNIFEANFVNFPSEVFDVEGSADTLTPEERVAAHDCRQATITVHVAEEELTATLKNSLNFPDDFALILDE